MRHCISAVNIRINKSMLLQKKKKEEITVMQLSHKCHNLPVLCDY